MATGAPRVEVSITDNSLYTETTLGTNGGMVVVTPYGPKEPKFIQQWKDFLSTYFDREDLPMTVDRSVFEAYNFFTESAGAWCVRAVGTGALCSGAKFSNGLNSTENESLSVGVENPSDVILDDKQDYNLQLMLPYPGVNDKYSVKLYTYRPNLNFSPEEVLLETTQIDNVPEVQLDDVQAIIKPKLDNSFSIAVPLDSFQDGDEIVIRPDDSQSILPEPFQKIQST